jgi:hypothetical protein
MSEQKTDNEVVPGASAEEQRTTRRDLWLRSTSLIAASALVPTSPTLAAGTATQNDPVQPKRVTAFQGKIGRTPKDATAGISSPAGAPNVVLEPLRPRADALDRLHVESAKATAAVQ